MQRRLRLLGRSQRPARGSAARGRPRPCVSAPIATAAGPAGSHSQEHAREWAAALVTLELAERLLTNAASDPETVQPVDAVGVFDWPVTSPDGANDSFNDDNFQRQSPTASVPGPTRDPKNRNRFGVDVNRNDTVGSVFDGCAGGALDCLSSGAAGPAELAEAESSNVISLAKNHSNIPVRDERAQLWRLLQVARGAYSMLGRITLPRPLPNSPQSCVGGQTHRRRHQRLPRYGHLAVEHRSRRRRAPQRGW